MRAVALRSRPCAREIASGRRSSAPSPDAQHRAFARRRHRRRALVRAPVTEHEAVVASGRRGTSCSRTSRSAIPTLRTVRSKRRHKRGKCDADRTAPNCRADSCLRKSYLRRRIRDTRRTASRPGKDEAAGERRQLIAELRPARACRCDCRSRCGLQRARRRKSVNESPPRSPPPNCIRRFALSDQPGVGWMPKRMARRGLPECSCPAACRTRCSEGDPVRVLHLGEEHFVREARSAVSGR